MKLKVKMINEHKSAPAQNENIYNLSAEEAGLMAEYRNSIADMQAQQRGVMQMIMRSNKLPGSWTINAAGTVMQKDCPPEPVAPVVEPTV